MAIVTKQAWSDSSWTSLRHFWVLWEKNTDKKDQFKAKLVGLDTYKKNRT